MGAREQLFLYVPLALLFCRLGSFIVLPLFLGFVLSTLLLPLVERGVQGGLSRGVASFFVVFFFFIALLWGGFFLVSQVWQEAMQLRFFVDELQSTRDRWGLILPIPEEVRDAFFSSLLKVVSRSMEFLARIPDFLFSLLLLSVTTYFLCKDRPLLLSSLERVLPKRTYRCFFFVYVEVTEFIFVFFRTQFLLMGVSATLSFLGFSLLRVPYAFLLSCLTGLFDLLPLVGPSGVFLPLILGHFFFDNIRKTLLLVVLWGGILLIHQVLEPLLLSKPLGLHPLATVYSIFLGVKLVGVAGFILGPVLLIGVRAFLFREKIR